MDKLHKAQLKELLESYREKMNQAETHNWVRQDTKQDARLAVLQHHMERLLVLLTDQEKLLD